MIDENGQVVWQERPEFGEAITVTETVKEFTVGPTSFRQIGESYFLKYGWQNEYHSVPKGVYVYAREGVNKDLLISA